MCKDLELKVVGFTHPISHSPILIICNLVKSVYMFKCLLTIELLVYLDSFSFSVQSFAAPRVIIVLTFGLRSLLDNFFLSYPQSPYQLCLPS